MKSRRRMLTAIGTVGGISIAGCSEVDRMDSEGSGGHIELLDATVETTGGETRGTFEFGNDGDEEGTAEFGTQLRIGTAGVYGTYINETTVTVGPDETTTEDVLLVDRTALPEVADEELNDGYFEVAFSLNGEEVVEQERGNAPSRHVSFRVLYDGTWHGALGAEGSSRNIQEDGDGHFAVDDDAFVVSGNAQKQDNSGRELIVQIIVDGDVIAEEVTTTDFGVAQVAAEPSESPMSTPREPYEPVEVTISEQEPTPDETTRETEAEPDVVSTAELSPEEVVEADTQAIVEGDEERYRELTHSESPILDEVSWEELDGLPDDVSWEIIEIEVVERDDETVVVREEIIEEGPQGRFRFVSEYTLREENGWKIWSSEPIETEELD